MQNDKEATKKVFDDLAKRYANRNGGYTRILKQDEFVIMYDNNRKISIVFRYLSAK